MKKIIILFLITTPIFAQKKPFNIAFSSNSSIEVYNYWEGSMVLKKNASQNPFTETKIIGKFTDDKNQTTIIDGFCDSQDGLISKIRFMPTHAGKYQYQIIYQQGQKEENISGEFTAQTSNQKGILRVDKENPWHFVWEGSGEHFFWNATTTYWMLGWKDEKIIMDAIDRLAKLRINRIRVAINARQDDGKRWNETLVKESKNFTFKLNPWLAKYPDDLDNPEFDVTRFNVLHWQKLDRLIAKAKEKNIIVSLIFYVDGLDHGCDPFKKTNMGNADEQRYYQYAAARYSAFSNITWDVTNEYHLFRNEAWVEKMGTFLKASDPNKHLISVHGHADFPFRKSPWVDFILYQSWDECGGYGFMSECRKKQEETGRFLPQINEEYGYEDHYAEWGCGAKASKAEDGRAADNRRRLAMEMYMAGCYQTTGERANEGTGAGKDEGGGWINGRGNEAMTMLKYYGYMMDIFAETQYWKLSPRSDLVDYGNLCLANIGNEYIVYSRLNHCRLVLPKGNVYSVKMINPRTGLSENLPDCDVFDGAWQYPKALKDDWVFILKKK
jgi:Protein of unknown function (DUF4038)/Domain of unknown function (DUF5060)